MKEEQHKIAFIQTTVPFSNRLVSHFGRVTSQVYNIHAIIIDYLNMKFYADDAITTTAAIKELNLIKQDTYSLKICNIKHLKMAVRYISSVLSFKQAAISAQLARLVFGAVYLRGFTELVVRM